MIRQQEADHNLEDPRFYGSRDSHVIQLVSYHNVQGTDVPSKQHLIGLVTSDEVPWPNGIPGKHASILVHGGRLWSTGDTYPVPQLINLAGDPKGLLADTMNGWVT